MYENYCALQAFSKRRSIFVKNHRFFSKIVISRVWEKKREQPDSPMLASIAWEVGGGGRGGGAVSREGRGRSNFSRELHTGRWETKIK